jgi:hypothetical protein
MQVQVNSDRSVNVDDEFSQLVEMTVNKSLARFDGRITRVEVHLSDVNSGNLAVMTSAVSWKLDRRAAIQWRSPMRRRLWKNQSGERRISCEGC